MVTIENIVVEFERKRRSLRMPVQAIARLSGLSASSVYRVMRNGSNERLSTLTAIANVLGIKIGIVAERQDSAIIGDRVNALAERLATMAQGTFALEGQEIGPDAERGVRRQVAKGMLKRAKKAPSQTLWL